MDLENTFDKINIASGDKILVHSNILKILIKLKKKNKKFNANLIIDSLINKVGPNGTIMFAAYNWDFCKGIAFDYNESQSMAGSLGSFALKRKDFRRTKNPIYSFAVTGKDKDYLCNLNHNNCFDLDSPFGYMIKNHAKNLFIGMDYKDGFTLCHVAEQAVGVNYRILKDFSGSYIDKFKKKRKVNFKMYVRNLNTDVARSMIDKKMDKVLIKNHAYEKKIVDGIILNLIDMNKAYKIMKRDLQNKGGLVYTKKLNI